jgi:steroid 5-alpha reductase family enzyme
VSLATLWGLAALLMAAVMAATFALAVRVRNFGWVDVAWSWNFALLAAHFALLGAGHAPRRALIGGMVALWSLRLGAYLFRRVSGRHPVEDGRYARLRRDWAHALHARFFVFFQAQGTLNVLLAAPLALACVDPEPRLRANEWAAAGLWLIAVAGEALADRQLETFKADPEAHGRVCRVGLWRLSRHPNYFFEWLVWCAYFLFVAASPWGWVTVACPLLMLFFLFRVTGIPATEEQALRSKGDAYREYQRTTSAFVPWWPRAS